MIKTLFNCLALAALLLLFLYVAHRVRENCGLSAEHASAVNPQRSAAPIKPLALEPCEIPGVKGKARCGTYEVDEDRAAQKGRRIGLKIALLPATGSDRAADPLFYIPGGPGSSATEDAPGVAEDFAQIREHRDLVFVDQRGTGGSNPLNCDLYNSADLQSYLGDYFPPEDVRRCRQELERKADLTLYTTPIAMDDLDEVRAALGYSRINIFGGSYGTRAAQVYLKQHPEHVRTMILQGISPTSQDMPRDFPLHTERALDGILDECQADTACRAAFPNLRAEARAVRERLLREPVEVEVLNPQTGQLTKIKLSHDLAAEAVRYMLYQSGSAGEVPLFLHRAAQGDYTPLAEAALYFRRQLVAGGSTGLYLSITCAEDLPWIKPGEGERLAAGTFLGDYRLRQQREACALWPRAKVPADYGEAVRSSVPVLLLTGEWDPVTPPLYGETLAKSLPNSLHLVVPHGGHGFGGLEGLDCIQRLMAEFVERDSSEGLDSSCVRLIHRRAFPVKPLMTRPISVAESELEKFMGQYATESYGAEADIKAFNGKLEVSLQGSFDLIFAPVSRVRFRAAGTPSLYLIFDVVEGQVKNGRLEQDGTPVLKLIPKKGSQSDARSISGNRRGYG